MNAILQVGARAPEFSAKAYVEGGFRQISLADFRGQWLCLFFYPFDFTFICPTELRALCAREPRFRELNCRIVAASTDSEYAHRAWYSRDLKEVEFPVIADTSRSLSRAYQVLIEERGIAQRGTFLIDPEGCLQAISVHALGVGRSVEEILRTLQALQTGEMCPVEWKPGMATLGA